MSLSKILQLPKIFTPLEAHLHLNIATFQLIHLACFSLPKHFNHPLNKQICQIKVL